MSEYGFSVETSLSIVEAEARVRALLQEEGFGVLTEIDVASTLRDKLDVEFRPYRILGACNPQLAHRALQAEPAIGLLLPCNVVVETTEQGTKLTFLDPVVALGLVGNRNLEPIAAEAAQRLRRVAGRMASDGAK